MLLFKKAFWEGLVRGDVTLTFRRWQKPHVRTGGRYRCHPIGVLEVDDVALVPARSISEDDAARAGFASRDALLAYLEELGPVDDDTQVYRVAIHHGGDGDRAPLALDADLAPDDVVALERALERLDARKADPKRRAAWTWETLELIEKNPRVVARSLAAAVGRETAPFKEDVRKLKKLGLTQSFEIGYEISPRGRAFLAAIRGRRPGAKKRARAAATSRGSSG